jgi:ferredoxin-NADP reductase
MSLPFKAPSGLLVGELGSEHLWQGGRLSLRCVQIIDETHDVKTFRFAADPPKLFFHRPGQFVTLEVNVDGKAVRRSYTISASPSRPHLLSVTVKKFPGGLISTWLHKNLGIGDTLCVDGPFGKFTCVDDARPHLFISGGSGITPVMAMARWLCDTAAEADIDFIHFARSPDDLVFADELRLMSRDQRGFRCHFVCTRADADTGWKGAVGRISRELLAELVPDFNRRSVYLCGPLGFMDAARAILERSGCAIDRVHQEIFGGLPRRNREAADAQAGTAAKLIFAASNIEVDCAGSDYILDIALEHGLEQPFSCRSGLCGTCKVALIDGVVEHDSDDGLSADDVRNGLILSCQARPIGRVVVHL